MDLMQSSTGKRLTSHFLRTESRDCLGDLSEFVKFSSSLPPPFSLLLTNLPAQGQEMATPSHLNRYSNKLKKHNSEVQQFIMKEKGKGDSGEVHASPKMITATVLIKLKSYRQQH